MSSPEPLPPPDREITCAGDFASTGGGDGPVHYGSGKLPLQAGEDIEILLLPGSAAAGHTFTLRTRGNASADTWEGFPGGVLPICGAGIQSVAIDAPDSSVLWRKVPHGQLLAGSRTGITTVQPANGTTPFPTTIAPPTLIDTQAFAGSIANNTADAVSQAGAIAIPEGALINFRLSVDRTLATPADPLTYVSLVGATSGTIYARLFTNGGAVASSFRMPVAAGEKLDIHTANADTVAHNFAASWDAWSGV